MQICKVHNNFYNAEWYPHEMFMQYMKLCDYFTHARFFLPDIFFISSHMAHSLWHEAFDNNKKDLLRV